MAVQYTGHPDFIPTQSTPVPVLAAELGTQAVGSSWGPETVNVTSGGAYMLTVNPATASDTTVTDITVQHYDVNGTLMQTDFFGAVFTGGNINVGLITSEATIVRGNLYGATIKISGEVATQAWLNTVSDSAGLTEVGANINCYILPNGLGDPDPRMNNGSAEVIAATGATPGNVLTFLSGGTVSSDENVGPYFLVPYSGPATLIARQTGLSTTPTNWRMNLAAYTVANGSSAVFGMDFTTQAQIVPNVYSIDIPACLMVATYANLDGTQSASPSCSVIAARAA